MNSPALTPVPPHVPPERVVDFDIYNPPGGERGIFEAWRELSDGPDFVWSPHHGGHWIATRGADIWALYADTEHFTHDRKSVPHMEGRLRLLPFEADAPMHAEYRKPLIGHFTPKAIDAILVSARRYCVELIEGIQHKRHSEFVADIAMKLPIAVVMEQMALPWEDRPELLDITEIMIRHPDAAVKAEAFSRLLAYLERTLESRRAKPGPDLISKLLQLKVSDRPMTQTELLGICSNLVLGGLDTVTSTLGFITHFLATHPEQRKQLAADPIGCAPRAVDELLRRFSVANPGRCVKRDMAYKGVQFKAGEIILLPGSLHGMDARVCPDPMTVDFNRPHVITSVFGNGQHRCLGSYLARSELRMFLEEWFQRIPEFHLDERPNPMRAGSGAVNAVQELHIVW